MLVRNITHFPYLFVKNFHTHQWGTFRNSIGELENEFLSTTVTGSYLILIFLEVNGKDKPPLLFLAVHSSQMLFLRNSLDVDTDGHSYR